MQKNLIVGVIVLIVCAIVLGKAMSNRPAVSEETSSDTTQSLTARDKFDKALKEKKPIWVLAGSTWCQPCQVMKGIADEVMPDFKDDITYIRVLVDDKANEPLLRELQVRVIPTSVFFDNSGMEVERKMGIIRENDLVELLQNLKSQE